jgi:serine/threonine protein kinase
MYYQLSSTLYIGEYFGITQDYETKDMIFIMPYYNCSDLSHFLKDYFFNLSWKRKLSILRQIMFGLQGMHEVKIIHKDLHGGNIFLKKYYEDCDRYHAYIGDFGISGSAIEPTDNKEIYGIIPYIAPEIFRGQKYTEASDIYSYGMIMWEVMTGRKPFWDESHDTELIIKNCHKCT